MPDLNHCVGMPSSCAIIVMRQPDDLMNNCGKQRQELYHNDDYIIKSAATARSHTSVTKIRLVVVAYMASNFITVSGYLQCRFQVLGLN